MISQCGEQSGIDIVKANMDISSMVKEGLADQITELVRNY
jgi:hypothetical protein